VSDRDLFDPLTPDGSAFVLPVPVPCLTATLRGERTASCDGVTVVASFPVMALCGALYTLGRPDSAMQLVDRNKRPLLFVESVHAVARFQLESDKPMSADSDRIEAMDRKRLEIYEVIRARLFGVSVPDATMILAYASAGVLFTILEGMTLQAAIAAVDAFKDAQTEALDSMLAEANRAGSKPN
jgi:hypothetical protein